MYIGSISFDGMHRSGKGSQIKMIREELSKLNINNIGVRGEYYRKGTGNNDLEDPYSLRRQKNQLNNNYEEKSNRLNRELFILYNKSYKDYLIKKGLSKGIIIQDRSIVGNYLFLESENKEIENIQYFNYGSKKGVLKNKIIIPELIFVLQPSKDELLKRLYSGYNKNERFAKERLEYKERYINEKYEKYYNGLNKIPEEIKKDIILILGDKSKEEIHDVVKTHILQKYNGILF